jgi:hypothetical protein
MQDVPVLCGLTLMFRLFIRLFLEYTKLMQVPQIQFCALRVEKKS